MIERDERLYQEAVATILLLEVDGDAHLSGRLATQESRLQLEAQLNSLLAHKRQIEAFALPLPPRLEVRENGPAAWDVRWSR